MEWKIMQFSVGHSIQSIHPFETLITRNCAVWAAHSLEASTRNYHIFWHFKGLRNHLHRNYVVVRTGIPNYASCLKNMRDKWPKCHITLLTQKTKHYGTSVEPPRQFPNFLFDIPQSTLAYISVLSKSVQVSENYNKKETLLWPQMIVI